MISKEVIENIIENELNSTSDISNWHGITPENVKRYLVPPHKEFLIDPITNSKQQYWVVLDKNPLSKTDGYLIIYSEEHECFGLATKQNMKHPDLGTCIGLYDCFIDALNAM